MSSLQDLISCWPKPCTRANCLSVVEMYSKYALETVFKWEKVQKIKTEPQLPNKVKKHKNLSLSSDWEVLFPSAGCLTQGLKYAMQEFYHRGNCQVKLNTWLKNSIMGLGTQFSQPATELKDQDQSHVERIKPSTCLGTDPETWSLLSGQSREPVSSRVRGNPVQK